MKYLLRSIVLLIAIICIIPVIFIFVGMFMRDSELENVLGAVVNENAEYAVWHFVPLYPTLQNIIELLFDTPEYFVLFWNSVKITVLVLLGQFVFAVPAAWGLAGNVGRNGKYDKHGKPVLLLYMFCMLLPFQVTMLSQYIVLNQLSVINTHWALILPLVFSTFPIFIVYSSFKQIPQSVVEAARIDGAGPFRIYWCIAIPIAKNGIFAAGILGFFEYWNMVEQPAIFIKDKSLWPLSVYLPDISEGEIGRAFAFSMFSVLPALLLLISGRNTLMEGISIGEMGD